MAAKLKPHEKESIITELIKACSRELETVRNDIAASINLDGVDHVTQEWRLKFWRRRGPPARTDGWRATAAD